MITQTEIAPHVREPKAISFPTRQFGTVNVIMSTYRNGDGLAVELVDTNGDSIAMLSVNIPECSHQLGDGEFFVKTWSENAELAEDAFLSGLFHETGCTSDDNVSAQIWKFK